MFKKWSEVLNTSDEVEYYKVKELLRENNIKYKTKFNNNNLRLSMNNLDGRSPSLSRDAFVKSNYIILIETDDLRYFESIKRKNEV